MSDKFEVEAWYDHMGEDRSAKLTMYLKQGDTRMKVILETVRNGFRIETKERGIFRFIPPHRIFSVIYPE